MSVPLLYARTSRWYPDLNASEVPVMLLAEHKDVVTQSLEAHRCVPHVFRHFDAFANFVLALDEELARRLVCANLLTLQDTINPKANPPDVATRVSLPNAPYLFPFSRHKRSLRNQNSKVSPEVSPTLLGMKKPLGLRGFGLRNLFIL
jgi:hypothetical protein